MLRWSQIYRPIVPFLLVFIMPINWALLMVLVWWCSYYGFANGSWTVRDLSLVDATLLRMFLCVSLSSEPYASCFLVHALIMIVSCFYSYSFNFLSFYSSFDTSWNAIHIVYYRGNFDSLMLFRLARRWWIHFPWTWGSGVLTLVSERMGFSI